MYRIIGGDGREYGPISKEQVREWISEGRVNAHTRARAEGGTDWLPIAVFPEFADLLGSRQPAGGAGDPLARPAALPPPATRTNTMAVTGLVSGILSLICCPLLSILGIIFSSIGISQTGKSGVPQSGRGIAIAGLVISIIALVLHTLLLVFWGLLGAVGELIQK